MHVDLDAFFVSVECAQNPELRGKPVVVGGNPEKRGVAAAVSYEARSYGIHSGMPLKTAARLCPKAVFVVGNHCKYREVSGQFMAILANFSPFVEPLGIDEAFLDATGFESLHGSIRQLAQKIRRSIREELGITASIGVAGCKTAAKIASRRAKPNGLLIVSEGRVARFLAPLEIGSMPGIGPKTESVLRNMGITTLGKLASTPPERLKPKLGSYGPVLVRFASGIDDRPVKPSGEAKSISRETTFAEDTRSQSMMESVLWALSEHTGASLRKYYHQARCITLKLRFSDFSTISRSRTLPEPVDSDRDIFTVGRDLLDREIARSHLSVRLVGIGVSSLVETGLQLRMLDADYVRQESLNRTVDQIRRKYGFDSIKTGRTMRLEELFR